MKIVKNQTQMESIFRYMFLFIFMMTFTGLHSAARAQEKDAELIDPTVDVSRLTPEYYNRLSLPPLSVFLEAAESCSKANYQRALKEEQEGILVRTKREWMSSLRLFGNYQYGAVGANIINATSGIQGQSVLYSSQLESLYNGGAALTLPLDVIWDRKNRIRTQQAHIKQIDYQLQQVIQELKIEVSEYYITAIQQLNTLKVRAETVVLANSDIQMSQTNYLNGHLTLAELNFQKSLQSTAISNYEATKAELNKAILHLELLTNVKILKKE